jgi:hypothetical protein
MRPAAPSSKADPLLDLGFPAGATGVEDAAIFAATFALAFVGLVGGRGAVAAAADAIAMLRASFRIEEKAAPCRTRSSGVSGVGGDSVRSALSAEEGGDEMRFADSGTTRVEWSSGDSASAPTAEPAPKSNEAPVAELRSGERTPSCGAAADADVVGETNPRADRERADAYEGAGAAGGGGAGDASAAGGAGGGGGDDDRRD